MSFPVPSGVDLQLDAASIAQGDGTTVSTWPDTSGSGNDFTYSSGPGATLWLSGSRDGVPYVEFATTVLHNASYSLDKQAGSFLAILDFQTVTDTQYILNFGTIDVVFMIDANLKDVWQWKYNISSVQ